jgi:hypothetical protein
LMKRTEIKKIPSHKWVIEDLCAGCHAALSASISDVDGSSTKRNPTNGPFIGNGWNPGLQWNFSDK